MHPEMPTSHKNYTLPEVYWNKQTHAQDQLYDEENAEEVILIILIITLH